MKKLKIIQAKLENVPTILTYMRKGPVVLPTDTFYALAAPISNKSIYDRVYELKGMKMNSSSPIGFYGLRDMERYCIMDTKSKYIVKELMPGPLTLILPARMQGHWVISDKIGARIPANEITREIIRNIGPITLTGANIRGFKAPNTIDECTSQFGDKISLYVDGGILPGIPSTIYDYINKSIIREGAITLREIRRAESGV